jgi:uncharacterized membrane protein YkvA (DUF1232 family)
MLKLFIKNVFYDPRIPKEDRKILIILLVLIISPIDFIPDWIPFWGLLDDFVMLSLVIDYFIKVLDSSILLSHYPWSMKSFARLERVGNFFSLFAPAFIKNNLWKYKRDPF